MPIAAERTVLVTGGTGGIGAAVARHLAAEHGARQLLLVSRSGLDAPGAGELRAELEGLGATVRVEACDVTDRAALELLLDSIATEAPLGAVIHSAGAIDDGVIESMDAERLARVMRPKVDAAWNLHELTAEMELEAFVLFSSAAGILGGAAQTSYAAANAFLDALAAHRRALGLPATSLAWGLWAQASRLAGDAETVDVARFAEQVRARLGFVPMAVERGLDLFDAAGASGEALLVAADFDRRVLRDQARAGFLPAVLRGLVRVTRMGERDVPALRELLADVPEAEREAVVLGAVRGHVAAVLGHASADAVEVDQAFRDLGLDSLGAVELRNRLAAASGLHFLPTLAFDHPSARAVTVHLLEELDGAADGAAGRRRDGGVAKALADLEMAIASLDGDNSLRDEAVERLRDTLARAVVVGGGGEDGDMDRIDAMDLDDLVERALEPQGSGSKRKGQE